MKPVWTSAQRVFVSRRAFLVDGTQELQKRLNLKAERLPNHWLSADHPRLGQIGNLMVGHK